MFIHDPRRAVNVQAAVRGPRARGSGGAFETAGRKARQISWLVGPCPDPSRPPDADREPANRDPADYIHHMLDATQQQGLVTRLNRIEGQVRGIRRMVQESRRCLEILQQLAAAEAALNRVSLAVLKVHVESCVPAAAAEGSEPQAKALAELVDIFDRFAR